MLTVLALPDRVERAVSAPPGEEESALHVGPGQPYSSINAAIESAPAGATIVVHDGLNGRPYREALGGGRGNGAALGKPLALMAAAGSAPVVSGADDISDGWFPAGPGRWVRAWRSPFPAPGEPGFRILPDQIDPEHPAAAHREQVFVGSTALTQIVLNDARSPIDSLLNEQVAGRPNFFYDGLAGRLHIGVDPAAGPVEVSTRDRAILLGPGAAGSTLRGLTFTRYAPAHVDGEAAVVIDAPRTVVEDVTVRASAAAGLFARGRDITLRHVRVEANGARGAVITQAPGLLVEGSTFDANNTEGFDHRACGEGVHCVLAGLKLTNTIGATIRNSSFSHNRSHGLWCDLGCGRILIAGNQVDANEGSGIFYEVSSDGVVAANVITGQRANGTAGLFVSGSRAVVVARNTFAGNVVQLRVADDPRQSPAALDVAGNLFADLPGRPAGLVLHVGAPVGGRDDEGAAPRSWFNRLDRDGFVLQPPSPGREPRLHWSDLSLDGPADLRALAGLESDHLLLSTTSSPFAAPGDYTIVEPAILAFAGVTLPETVAAALGLPIGPPALGSPH